MFSISSCLLGLCIGALIIGLLWLLLPTRVSIVPVSAATNIHSTYTFLWQTPESITEASAILRGLPSSELIYTAVLVGQWQQDGTYYWLISAYCECEYSSENATILMEQLRTGLADMGLTSTDLRDVSLAI